MSGDITKQPDEPELSNFDVRNIMLPHSISNRIALGPYPEAKRMGLSVELLVSLLRTVGALRNAQEPVLRRHNLVSAGWRALGALYFHPEHTMPLHILSTMLGVTRAHITGVIDALEHDGLVERVPHAEDRRVTLARMTAKGRVRVEQIGPEYNAVITEMFKPLSDADIEQMLGLLFCIRTHLGNLDSSDGNSET